MPVTQAHRRRDPEATRSAILDSAEQIFAERGFAATSTSDVARRAGVTKSLIHHHFRSKEDLWDEVKRRRTAAWAETQRQLNSQGKIDEPLLRKSMEVFFRFLQGSPEFVRLYSWMSLEDPHLSQTVQPDLMEVGVRRLREAQMRGTIRQDVSPEHIMILIISLCVHWFMSKNWNDRAGLVDAEDPAADDHYLDDMLKVFLEGILPR